MRPSQLLVIGLAATAVANSHRRRQDSDFALGYGKPGRTSPDSTTDHQGSQTGSNAIDHAELTKLFPT